MATKLICDTNIWYRLSDGRLSIGDMQNDGEVLHLVPFSIIEIVGKITPDNFVQRRAVCQTIVTLSPPCLDLSETVMSTAFGWQATDTKSKCVTLAAQVANAHTYDEVNDQIVFSDEDKEVRVDIAPVRDWRSSLKKNFDNGMISYFELIDAFLTNEKGENPGLASYHRLTGQQKTGVPKPRLTQDQYDKLLNEINSNLPRYRGYIYRSCLNRVLQHLDVSQPYPNEAEINTMLQSGYSSLLCFCHIYLEYILQVVTQENRQDGRKWETNDRLDAENFVYSNDPDSIIVTCDEKWADLASDAGYPDRVRCIKLKNQK